jgi:YHS domain-containing protein
MRAVSLTAAHRAWILAIVSLALSALLPLASAQSAPEAPAKVPRDLTHFNLDKAKLALQGYDPVAYFPAGGGKPKKGRPTITATHEGVVYRFASEEHRKLFLATPAQFEPQYGGWCAYAMADKEKVAIDPESFLLTDGKLYLFFKAWYADTRAKWKKDEKRLAARADRAWQDLTAPKPLPPK